MNTAIKIFSILLFASVILSMTCPDCRNIIDDDAVFCPHCGYEIQYGYVLVQKARTNFGEISQPTILTLDGFEINQSPPFTVKLLPGKHTIIFQCNDKMTRNFGIIANNTTIILLECYAETKETSSSFLTIKTLPNTASILVNNITYSSNDTIRLANEYLADISISQNGFIPRDTVFYIAKDKITSVSIELNHEVFIENCIKPKYPVLQDTIRKGELNLWGLGLMLGGLAMVSIPAATDKTNEEFGKKDIESWQIGMMVGGAVSFLSGGFMIGSRGSKIDQKKCLENQEKMLVYKRQLEIYNLCKKSQPSPTLPKPFKIQSFNNK